MMRVYTYKAQNRIPDVLKLSKSSSQSKSYHSCNSMNPSMTHPEPLGLRPGRDPKDNVANSKERGKRPGRRSFRNT